MYIRIAKDLAEITIVGITALSVFLNETFKKYEQLVPLEIAETLNTGQVVLPIMMFEEVVVEVKTKKPFDAKCTGRFVVYSKQPTEIKPCNRFIHAERCYDREVAFKNLPKSILDAAFDAENTVNDLVTTLGAVISDKKSFFYSVNTNETSHTFQIAVIHEFGEKDNPHCVATAVIVIETDRKQINLPQNS